MNIDETLDYYFKTYPRSTRNWIDKILSRSYHGPFFPQGGNELELRKAENEKHTLQKKAIKHGERTKPR